MLFNWFIVNVFCHRLKNKKVISEKIRQSATTNLDPDYPLIG